MHLIFTENGHYWNESIKGFRTWWTPPIVVFIGFYLAQGADLALHQYGFTTESNRNHIESHCISMGFVTAARSFCPKDFSCIMDLFKSFDTISHHILYYSKLSSLVSQYMSYKMNMDSQLSERQAIMWSLQLDESGERGVVRIDISAPSKFLLYDCASWNIHVRPAKKGTA